MSDNPEATARASEKLWCPICGRWGDHRSGACPTNPALAAESIAKAYEYVEALNDIADFLGLPTGATPRQVVEAAENAWARGLHTCSDYCMREACVLRRELAAERKKNRGVTSTT